MKPRLLNLGCGSFVHEDWVNVDFSSENKNVISHNLSLGVPFESNTFDAVYHSHVLEHFRKQDAILFLKECDRVLKTGGLLRVVVPDLEQICIEYLKWLKLAEKGIDTASLNYEWIVVEMLDQMVRTEPGGLMADYLRGSMPNREYVEQRIGVDITEQSFNRSNKILNKIKAYLKRLFKKINNKHLDYYMVGKFRRSGEVHQWMYDKYYLEKILVTCGFVNIQQLSSVESDIPDFISYGLDFYKGKERGCSSLFMEAVKP